jgi:hypothetical protein
MSEWFSNPRSNVNVRDAGYSIEVLGQTGIRYSEAEKSAFIDSEVMNDPDTMLICERSISKWDPPYDSEPLSDKGRARRGLARKACPTDLARVARTKSSQHPEPNRASPE